MADVILIGASVRALAFSARRAGYSPLCVDLFRDADLLADFPDSLICPFSEYPHGFLEILQSLPASPLIYSGGFENHPDLIGQIARRHQILGNSADVLRRVRDPFAVHAFLQAKDWPRAAVRRDSPVSDTSLWLRKRQASSAGRGVRRAMLGDATDGDHFFQEFVPGNPHSVMFRAGEQARSGVTSPSTDPVVCIGVCEQLIGCEWLNAKPFWYCGNIGPIGLECPVREQVGRLAELAAAFDLRGCFGVDFVLGEAGVVPVEINPRYSASAELYERHSPALSVLRGRGVVEDSPGLCLGKAIWHTPHACRVLTDPRDVSWEQYADLPHKGQEFGVGEPLVTIFARSADRDGVMRELQRQAERIPVVFRLERC